MDYGFKKILKGYQLFRQKYAHGDMSVMQHLSLYGQKPHIMIIACCDARVDPALIMQCEPGDLFVVRNVANIVPPYEKDKSHHGTSSALEFGITVLNVKNLIVLGHSQCGGVQAVLNESTEESNDFITSWVSLIKSDECASRDADEYARFALTKSKQNCMTFPWIEQRVNDGSLVIHLWFFDIKEGQIFTYCQERSRYEPLSTDTVK
jgi:carbonic anhydrase